jgi:hypothetical protein
MSKAEGEKFAHIMPLGSFSTESGSGVLVIVASSDRETGKEALRDYALETGATSWVSQEIDREANPKGGTSFYFSGDKWKAPWQPVGPKSNWIEKEVPKQPIN